VRAAIFVFLLASVLIWPLYKIKYTTNWASIESTFIADGRFLKDHWPHPRWQPLWYCGTRFDYIYPPALRYGTAALSKYLPILPVRGYHIYTAFFYAIGIAAVFLFVLTASGSYPLAWLASIATAFVSPSFLFLSAIREDSVYHWPQRLHALIRYGEGPHITALALLPLALAAAWVGVRRGHNVALALAAVFSALVVSNNFYGATALAMFFPVLVWSLWVVYQDHWILVRAAAIALLAYGLTAFWLVPSYLRVTLRNMQYVSDPGNRWSIWVGLAVAVTFAALSLRFARNRHQHAWIVFVLGSAIVFSLNVLGHHYVGFLILGAPGRLVPELDFALILLGLEGLRRLWRLGRPFKAAAAALFAGSFVYSAPYLARPWDLVEWDPRPHERIEYRITEWMARNMPDTRAVTTGSVRFWYNTWFDLPQLGGGSEQGLLNQMVVPPQWQAMASNHPELDILWMQAMGTGAIIVHDERSQEIYKDFGNPRKYEGMLPAVYDSGEGDIIYRVPRRYPAFARVVDRERALAILALPVEANIENLRTYVEVVEHGPEVPVESSWLSTDEMHIRAQVESGQAVVAQVSYDPAWRAYTGGNSLAIQRDAVGFMLIEVPPGTQDIRLIFELPAENAAGRAVTLASIAALGFLVFVPRKRKRAA
jgi:hypothetical protein